MINKEPFVFSYVKSSLDWYDIIEVTVNWGDYDFFELERRYDSSWWLVGYTNGERKTLGQLSVEDRNDDVKRFIEWAETDMGSAILRISGISSTVNMLDGIWHLLKELKND